MIKKGISLLLVSFFVLGFSTTAFADYNSPQWSLRPDTSGDWGQARVRLGTGETAFYLTINQQGIHSGQKAHTYWEVTHPETGKTEYTKDANSDFYGTLIINGLKNPGGTYDVIWESKTNNDTEGWYQLYVNSGKGQFWRLR